LGEIQVKLAGNSLPVLNGQKHAYRVAHILLNEAYRDSLIGSFNDRYLAKCLSARYNENFTVYAPISEFHYTLYYYDQAGNLLKTIAP
jgi:hypothetical protein